MRVQVRSFAKINLGLAIGPRRRDGFHDLRTVYQTIALHDVLRLDVVRASGIEIRCEDKRVPADETNTCYKVAERVLDALGAKSGVVIEIEKRLPVQGGLGGASGNAIATLLAIERALKRQLPASERLRIAAEVGSDLPLFLIGGTVLGVGRGEEVYPAPDLPSCSCVIATPGIGVSTPQAFADWDEMGLTQPKDGEARRSTTRAKLTGSTPSDKMIEFSRRLSSWLSGSSGVPARSRGRAETLLLDLVHTGIANDFEQVVFPKHPELSEVKRVLERAGAFYAALSGSGSAVYGLFRAREAAQKAASRLQRQGIPARASTTLTREQYWKRIWA